MDTQVYILTSSLTPLVLFCLGGLVDRFNRILFCFGTACCAAFCVDGVDTNGAAF